MLETSTICFPVSNVHWNCASTSTKYCWFVHVIPNVVSLVRSFKVFVFELISPKILSILIKEIYPSWVTWPAVTIEISKIRISYKNIRQISNWLLSVLKCKTIRINIVGVAYFNVRVNNDCNKSITCLNFCIHLINLLICKILRVKDKVLITFRVAILVSPFNIHPKNINRESVVRKVTVSLHHHISTNIVPFAEVETKHMNWCHWYESGYNRKVFLNCFDMVRCVWGYCRKNKKFKSARLGNEINIFAWVHIRNTDPSMSRIHPSHRWTLRGSKRGDIWDTSIKRSLIIWCVCKNIRCKQLIRICSSIL